MDTRQSRLPPAADQAQMRRESRESGAPPPAGQGIRSRLNPNAAKSTAVPLNVIVKLTRACNLRCEYCHDWRSTDRHLRFELLAMTIERVLAAEAHPSVRFIWHGGEPLLLGHQWFAKIIALEEIFQRPGQTISNTLQTNACLIDPAFAEFFRRHEFNIGVSLDGPAALHNAQRPSRDGKPTFERALKGIRLLQQQAVPFGVLTVLTHRSLQYPPAQLLEFYRDLEIFDIGFLPVRSDCRMSGEHLSTTAYVDYMKAMFDAWLAINDPRLKVREFSNWMLLAMGLPGNVCGTNGSCIGTAFSIEPNGDVYACDKLVQDPQYGFGNIEQIDFDRLRSSSRFCEMKNRDLILPRSCLQCRWRKVCAGGCLHDRYIDRLAGKNEQVCHLRRILAHVRHRIKDHPDVQLLMARAAHSEGSAGAHEGICI